MTPRPAAPAGLWTFGLFVLGLFAFGLLALPLAAPPVLGQAFATPGLPLGG